jgi:hypothetical protein
MAAPERTTREFSPEVQARRERKAAQAERVKAVALDSLDVGRGWSGPGRAPDVVDAGIAEAVATTSERVALRTARGGRAVQEAQRNLAAKKAAVRGQQTAGKPTSKPSLRDRLERMSESERLDVVESMRPGRERDYVDGLVVSIAEVEEEVEFRHARFLEEEQLAAYEDAEASTYWPEDSAPLTEAERRAEADLAAETAGPLFAGDPEQVYEDGYDFEEETE